MLFSFLHWKYLRCIGEDRLQFGLGARHKTGILNSDVRMDFQTDESSDIGTRVSQLILFIVPFLQRDEESFTLLTGIDLDCYMSVWDQPRGITSSREMRREMVQSTNGYSSVSALAVECTDGRMVQDLLCQEHYAVFSRRDILVRRFGGFRLCGNSRNSCTGLRRSSRRGWHHHGWCWRNRGLSRLCRSGRLTWRNSRLGKMFRSERLDVPFASESVLFSHWSTWKILREWNCTAIVNNYWTPRGTLHTLPCWKTLAPHHKKGRKYHILQIFGVPKSDHYTFNARPLRSIPSRIRSKGSSDSPILLNQSCSPTRNMYLTK